MVEPLARTDTALLGSRQDVVSTRDPAQAYASIRRTYCEAGLVVWRRDAFGPSDHTAECVVRPLRSFSANYRERFGETPQETRRRDG